MNLYLSSYRLGNHPERFQQLAGENKKTAVIANSMDYLANEDRLRGVQRELADMTALGFEPEELDLRDYFSRPDALASKLQEFGIVWARGGNSFLLRKAMEKSGFDTALTKRLHADPMFVYGGYSAGVVVLGPSLEGIEIVDDVHAKAEGYDTTTTWRGIGLLDYAIAPHFQSDHPESPAIDRVVDYFKEHEIPYKTLQDGQAIVIHGDIEELIE